MLMNGKPPKGEIEEEHFIKIKTEVEVFYKEVKPVNCPYLKKDVYFDAKGLDHIKFKSWQTARSRYDQYIRLKLFKFVPNILSKSHTLQGLYICKEWERRKRKTGWEKIQLEVTYYEFIAVISRARIKIIVKQLPGGELHFWSIIPFWRMCDKTQERELFDGNPSTD